MKGHKAGMRKLKNPILLNDGSLLSGLQRNALVSLNHFFAGWMDGYMLG